MNTLCQLSWGPHDDLLKKTGAVNAEWCARHGWRYLVHDENVYRLGLFDRFPIMVEAAIKMKDGEIVAYMDSDAMIMGDPEIDLPSHGFEIAMGFETPTRPNAGVIFERVSDMVVDFNLRCAKHKGEYPTKLSEAYKLEQVMLDNLGPVSLQRLGPEWNFWFGAVGAFTPPIRVRSWHGLPYARKMKEATHYVDQHRNGV